MKRNIVIHRYTQDYKVKKRFQSGAIYMYNEMEVIMIARRDESDIRIIILIFVFCVSELSLSSADELHFCL